MLNIEKDFRRIPVVSLYISNLWEERIKYYLSAIENCRKFINFFSNFFLIFF